MDDLLALVRTTADALPHVTCKISHGRPTWFVKGKSFLVLHAEGHHQNGFPHLWCAAEPGVQEELVAAFPERFFRPPYVGVRGWLGVRLDREPEPDAVARLCREAWNAVAPPKLRG